MIASAARSTRCEPGAARRAGASAGTPRGRAGPRGRARSRRSGRREPNRAAEGRAVEDVERARAPPEPDGIPERVPGHARRAPRAAEREQLELDPGRSRSAASSPRTSRAVPGARLHERRDVDADPHDAAAPARSASRAVSYFMRLERLARGRTSGRGRARRRGSAPSPTVRPRRTHGR